MNLIQRGFTRFLFAIATLTAAAGSPGGATSAPYVIVTSDTHLAASTGRYREQTSKVERFFNALDSRPARPDAVFIVGDVIDNTIERDGRLQPGTRADFESEVKIYTGLKRQHPRLAIMQALGPGHDFGGQVTLADAESSLGPAAGVWRWSNISFIWLTIPRAAFAPTAVYSNTLTPGEYEWLEKQLREAEQAVLLFHVPLRTDATHAKGVWIAGMNLTIDPRDQICDVIQRHAAKIGAIFCGHIHERMTTAWNGIPLYLAPFIAGDYATITRRPTDGTIEVHLHQLNPDGGLQPD